MRPVEDYTFKCLDIDSDDSSFIDRLNVALSKIDEDSPHLQFQRLVLALYRRIHLLLCSRVPLLHSVLTSLKESYVKRLTQNESFCDLLRITSSEIHQTFLTELLRRIQAGSAGSTGSSDVYCIDMGIVSEMTQHQIAIQTVAKIRDHLFAHSTSNTKLRFKQELLAISSPYAKLKKVKEFIDKPLVLLYRNADCLFGSGIIDMTGNQKQSLLYTLADMLHFKGSSCFGIILAVSRPGCVENMEAKVRSRLGFVSHVIPKSLGKEDWQCMCDAIGEYCREVIKSNFQDKIATSTVELLKEDAELLELAFRNSFDSACLSPTLQVSLPLMIIRIGASLQQILGFSSKQQPHEPSLGNTPLFKLVFPTTPPTTPLVPDTGGLCRTPGPTRSAQKRVRGDMTPENVSVSKRRGSANIDETHLTAAKRIAEQSPPLQTPLTHRTPQMHRPQKVPKSVSAPNEEVRCRQLFWQNLGLIDHMTLMAFATLMDSGRALITGALLERHALEKELTNEFRHLCRDEFSPISRIYSILRLVEYKILMPSAAQCDFRLPPEDEKVRSSTSNESTYDAVLSTPLFFPCKEEYVQFCSAVLVRNHIIPPWLKPRSNGYIS